MKRASFSGGSRIINFINIRLSLIVQYILIRREFGNTLQNNIEQFNAQVRDDVSLLNIVLIFLFLIAFNNSEICQKFSFEKETIGSITEINKNR